MTAPVVGWYAHHLGAGHVTRARTVAGRTSADVVILSSAPRPAGWPASRWVALPADDGPGGDDHTAGGTLHWAPLSHAGYRDRMAVITEWASTVRPAALVCDVSVEVLLLGRLLGLHTVGVVMAGDRRDRPHQAGYDSASRLVAAWPRAVAPVCGWRPGWAAKTTWTGGLSRFDGRSPGPVPGTRSVVVLWGRGSPVPSADLDAARAATPEWRWSSVVSADPDTVWRQLQSADVIVTHAGQNSLAEVAAAGRPAVVLPQPRPHDEQVHLAQAVGQVAPVTVCASWPDPPGWEQVLRRTAALDGGGWTAWSDGDAADRFAAVVDEAAGLWAA